MRRVFRQFRRPVVILAVFYLAGIGFLSASLPYRPRLQFRVEPHLPALVGFSPDGRMLVTTTGVRHLSTFTNEPEYAGEPLQFWNIAADRDPAVPLLIRERTDLLLWRLHWDMVDLPDQHQQPLFWTCAAAQEPRKRFAEIFPFTRELIELSKELAADGAFALSADGRFAVYQKASYLSDHDGTTWVLDRETRRGSYTLPTGKGFFSFGPGKTTLTTQEWGDKSLRAVVRRWDLASGRELLCREWADMPEDGRTVSPGGHWLVAGKSSVEDTSCVVFDIETTERRLAVPDAMDWMFANQDHVLITSHWATGEAPTRVVFWDLNTGTRCGEYRPDWEVSQVPNLHALSHNGQVAVVTLQGDEANILDHWPWLLERLKSLGLGPRKLDVIVLDTATGHVQGRLPGAPLFGGRFEPRVAFSDDGRQLAVVGEDNIVRIWDLPIRRPWGLIVSLAAIPLAAIALLLVAARTFRRRRTARA
jgi:hypothetical protein